MQSYRLTYFRKKGLRKWTGCLFYGKEGSVCSRSDDWETDARGHAGGCLLFLGGLGYFWMAWWCNFWGTAEIPPKGRDPGTCGDWRWSPGDHRDAQSKGRGLVTPGGLRAVPGKEAIIIKPPFLWPWDSCPSVHYATERQTANTGRWTTGPSDADATPGQARDPPMRREGEAEADPSRGPPEGSV